MNKIYKSKRNAQIAATVANKKAKGADYWVVDFILLEGVGCWKIRNEATEPHFYIETKG